MQRRWAAAAVLGLIAAGAGAVPVVIDAAGASTSSMTFRVSPNSGLVNGQTVTISGRGLVHSYHGSPQTWFATECTRSVQGRMNPSTDTLHCNITDAKAIHVGRGGTFTVRLRVVTGIIGDGYCGTLGHLSCVIGVGTSDGLGTVVRITFKNPATPVPATSTTTTASTAFR
jgi:hypothetical protein